MKTSGSRWHNERIYALILGNDLPKGPILTQQILQKPRPFLSLIYGEKGLATSWNTVIVGADSATYPSSERIGLITKQGEDEHLSPRSKNPRRHCRPCRKKRQVI
ncbi:MAG TPA: hypothetical protein VEQ38_13695 [Verrucomicrobiae bacterium]|nr:hypothetical protein [Verrucomicrobiae bacterium]